MVTITNLTLPASWTTALPNNPAFDISADELSDFLEATGDLDWEGADFENVGTINGFVFPGGTGGGGVDFATTALLRQEWIYTDADLMILEQYTLDEGQTDTGAILYGSIELFPDTTDIGTSGEIQTEESFDIFPAKTDSHIEFRSSAFNDDIDIGMVAVGIMDGNVSTADGVVEFFTNFASGFGFIGDKNDNANWQIFSKDSGGVTRTATSVAFTSEARFNLEMIYDEDNQEIEFKINGADVGTITTNLAFGTNAHFPLTGVYNITNIFPRARVNIGFWEVRSTRLP